MQIYASEEINVALDPHALPRAIRRAERVANRGVRTFTVSADDLVRFWGPWGPDNQRRRSVAYEWLGGWGCSNSMPQSTYTSLLGVAVWFAPDDSLHFRVVADRVLCPRSPKGDVHLDPFGLHPRELFRVQPYVLVYPCLWLPRPAPGDHSFLAEIRRALRNDPLDVEAWAVLGDWHEDRDEGEERIQCRLAVGYAQRVAGYFV